MPLQIKEPALDMPEEVRLFLWFQCCPYSVMFEMQEREAESNDVIAKYTKKLAERTYHHMG
jgi:hypothetical protein